MISRMGGKIIASKLLAKAPMRDINRSSLGMLRAKPAVKKCYNVMCMYGTQTETHYNLLHTYYNCYGTAEDDIEYGLLYGFTFVNIESFH